MFFRFSNFHHLVELNAQVSFTFHFSLFTFHFSLILQFTTLKALFPRGFALLLIFASASVFSSSPCTPDRAITTCDMGWTFLSPDSTGFVTGVLVEGGWEQPALLRFLANPEKIISENYCVLKRSWCQVLPTKEFRHALSQRSSCSSDERVQGSGACTPQFRQ